MSHGTEIFVRGGNDEVAAKVKGSYPTASIEKLPRFLFIRLACTEYNAPDGLLKELSMHGELYWVTISSPDDDFQYFHWDKGILCRALIFNGSTWEVVSGDPEPWERTAFFLDDLQHLPSWDKYHPQAEVEKPLSLGPDVVDSKGALHAVLSYYDFWN